MGGNHGTVIERDREKETDSYSPLGVWLLFSRLLTSDGW